MKCGWVPVVATEMKNNHTYVAYVCLCETKMHAGKSASSTARRSGGLSLLDEILQWRPGYARALSHIKNIITRILSVLVATNTNNTYKLYEDAHRIV